MSDQQEIKAIKLLQERSASIETSHDEIGSELDVLRHKLSAIGGVSNIAQSDEYAILKHQKFAEMSVATPLSSAKLEDIYADADARYVMPIELSDILNVHDFAEAEKRIGKNVLAFNAKYGLDGWDYAIAGSCGLFAAMLDLLCVQAPLKPTVKWHKKVDGVFNKWVQEAFNKFLPPDISKILSNGFPIGAPDSSTTDDLIGAPAKTMRPMNHRLRSLAHDPIIGIIFGVLDMLHGTCTTVVNGKIVRIPSSKGSTEGNIFYLIGRILGHLLSDVNAPSANGNRGMGLPAPFMGLLRMLEGIPVGDSSFGRQIELMYVKGYDFRQFVATSIPMAIMEAMLRAFYVGKQMKLYNAPFAETILDTLPLRLNPRFRMMLAIAYGTSSAVNAGKMIYVNGDILNANYASWMGLTWNGFHSLKWALCTKHLTLWNDVEEKEIAELERTIQSIEVMAQRATQLPA